VSDQHVDGTERFRKQAPKPHADWFWCLSGGLDSTAAFLLTRDALHDNYGKRPTPVYWDTGVGLPLNRLYLEELCDRYDEQLVTWRTNQSLERYVDENDAPGAGAHIDVRKLLKGQQSSKLTTLADHPVYVIGLRADESPNRAVLSKIVEKDRHVEVYPVHSLTAEECARIVLRHKDCPINPCWLYNHATDCFCLANGDPSELDATAERFPWFAQRIREIEEAADADGLRSTLGWDGLRAVEKKAIRQGQQQMTLCGSGCQRQRDPAVVRAFRARIHGATPAEAISILGGDDPADSGLVAATDGGNGQSQDTDRHPDEERGSQ